MGEWPGSRAVRMRYEGGGEGGIDMVLIPMRLCMNLAATERRQAISLGISACVCTCAWMPCSLRVPQCRGAVRPPRTA